MNQSLSGTLQVGIIGLGRFSRFHLLALRQQPGVRLTAVADVNEERVREVTAEWGCAGYADWSRMLEEERLDAVVVLTPEHHHAEPVMKALERGAHVFVEKPLAVGSEAAENLVKAAEQAGKQLMVGHVCRFDARLIQIRKAVEEGRIGKLRSFYSRRNNPKKYFHIYARTNPIYILGIHDIDLMQWIVDAPVEEVYAKQSFSASGQTDLVWSMLTFADGTIGVIENNWLIPDHAPAEIETVMEIVGDAGIIHHRDPDQSLQFWTDGAVATPASYSWNDTYGRPSGYLLEEMTHFYTCVQKNAPSSILKPRDALAAVRVAEAVIQSCETGIAVRIRN